MRRREVEGLVACCGVSLDIRGLGVGDDLFVLESERQRARGHEALQAAFGNAVVLLNELAELQPRSEGITAFVVELSDLETVVHNLTRKDAELLRRRKSRALNDGVPLAPCQARRHAVVHQTHGFGAVPRFRLRLVVRSPDGGTALPVFGPIDGFGIDRSRRHRPPQHLHCAKRIGRSTHAQPDHRSARLHSFDPRSGDELRKAPVEHDFLARDPRR